MPSSSFTNTTSADSKATSTPRAPMAIPTSEAASAGASLTPSPTIATKPSFPFMSSMHFNLSSGNSPAIHLAQYPRDIAVSLAISSLSPVNMAVLMFCRFKELMAFNASSLTSSTTQTAAKPTLPTETQTAVWMSPEIISKASVQSQPSSRINSKLPMATCLSLTKPTMPFPGTSTTSVTLTLLRSMSRSMALRTMACAMGWFENWSRAAA